MGTDSRQDELGAHRLDSVIAKAASFDLSGGLGVPNTLLKITKYSSFAHF